MMQSIHALPVIAMCAVVSAEVGDEPASEPATIAVPCTAEEHAIVIDIVKSVRADQMQMVYLIKNTNSISLQCRELYLQVINASVEQEHVYGEYSYSRGPNTSIQKERMLERLQSLDLDYPVMKRPFDDDGPRTDPFLPESSVMPRPSFGVPNSFFRYDSDSSHFDFDYPAMSRPFAPSNRAPSNRPAMGRPFGPPTGPVQPQPFPVPAATPP